MRRLLVLLVLLVPGVAHAGPTAHDVLVTVKTYYGGAKQLSADFQQEVTNATFGTKSKVAGTVRLKSRGRMRWDYQNKRTGKVNKSFVSSGKKLWMVDVGNKQVVIEDLKKSPLPAAITFLHGKGDLEKTFTAALDTSGTYGSSADYVVELTPKKASAAYTQIYLVVASDGSVGKTVVIDSAKNVNQFTFTNLDTSTAIPDKTFVYDPKAYAKYRIVTP